MWAYGVYDLKLSSEDFWNLTPAQLSVLSYQHREKLRREDWRVGIVASILVNINKKKGARSSQPEDFMPDPYPKKQDKQTPEQMLHFVKTILHPALGGK